LFLRDSRFSRADFAAPGFSASFQKEANFTTLLEKRKEVHKAKNGCLASFIWFSEGSRFSRADFAAPGFFADFLERNIL